MHANILSGVNTKASHMRAREWPNRRRLSHTLQLCTCNDTSTSSRHVCNVCRLLFRLDRRSIVFEAFLTSPLLLAFFHARTPKENSKVSLLRHWTSSAFRCNRCNYLQKLIKLSTQGPPWQVSSQFSHCFFLLTYTPGEVLMASSLPASMRTGNQTQRWATTSFIDP